MPLISHRGAAGLAPENSLESITVACTYEPIFIEVDLHRTADGVFVLYHGEVKQTLTGAAMPITFAELAQKVPHLCTLREALLFKKSAPLLLDVKYTEKMDELVAELESIGLPEGYGFTSPHVNVLIAIKRVFPSRKFFVSNPYHHSPIRAIEYARDQNFSGISLNKWWLNPFIYWLAGRYKKEIMVYTINRSPWVWFAQKFYPRANITTDYPNLYRKHFPLTSEPTQSALVE